MKEISGMSSIDQLCPKCGLCCDGTLFADVELQAGDDATRLSSLGIALMRKGKGKLAFHQPCAGYGGGCCRIYPDRPGRCRSFECGLLKRVAAGEMTAAAALRKIAKAKKLIDRVRRLLQQPDGRDKAEALTHCYQEAMSAPIDLAAGDADRRGDLMLAMNALMEELQRHFLTKGVGS